MKQPSLNIPDSIFLKMKRKNHLLTNHPVEIVKKMIFEHFGGEYKKFEDLNCFIPVEENFDILRIPQDHPSRGLSDTYYLDEKTVLRTHCTAHLPGLVASGNHKYLVCGDVYRKDAIDATHYPVFTQIDGFCLTDSQEPTEELKEVLSGIILMLFPNCNYRFLEDNFPFTINSIQAEVEYIYPDGTTKWIEVLGGGTVHPEIMSKMGLEGKQAWAFGLGIDRLAMILFGIPDIRLLWTDDKRFTKQFSSGKIVKFQPYSKYPPCNKDVAMWLPLDATFRKDGEEDMWDGYNDLCEIAREIAGDMIESVSLIDKFTHPKSGKISHCYRIVYRSDERTLTDVEVNDWQEKIRQTLVDVLRVELR